MGHNLDVYVYCEEALLGSIFLLTLTLKSIHNPLSEEVHSNLLIAKFHLNVCI